MRILSYLTVLALAASSLAQSAPILDAARELTGVAARTADVRLAERLVKELEITNPAPHLTALRAERRQFDTWTGDLAPNVRFRLVLLYLTREAVPRGLTDRGLAHRVGDGLIAMEVRRRFALAPVRECLAALDAVPPRKLGTVIDGLAGVIYEGSNPHSPQRTTWAADSLATVHTALMRSSLIEGSTAARLMAREGRLKRHRSTRAVFRWSGRRPVDIPLPASPLSRADLAPLRELAWGSPHDLYRKAATKALGALKAG